MPTVTIDRNPNNTLRIIPPSQHIRAGESVEWQTVGALAGKPFTVTFDQNAARPAAGPFQNSQFNQNSPNSGNPSPGTGPRYKYTVTCDGLTEDPDVIIDG
jgi:hypothetical protein